MTLEFLPLQNPELSSRGKQISCSSCGFLLVKVKDTGTGMSEAKLRSLFQTFGKHSGTDGAELGVMGTSGIGLGLSLSRELTQAMKGEILVLSKEGEGTIVTFKI